MQGNTHKLSVTTGGKGWGIKIWRIEKWSQFGRGEGKVGVVKHKRLNGGAPLRVCAVSVSQVSWLYEPQLKTGGQDDWGREKGG
jgi:hypothetical protein